MWWAGVPGLAAAGLGIVLLGRDGSSLMTGPIHPAPDDPVNRALRQGRPAVIHFGANACAACREMKPILKALQQAQGQRFTVMSVDLIAARLGMLLGATGLWWIAQVLGFVV